jgi:hypothetical protein
MRGVSLRVLRVWRNGGLSDIYRLKFDRSGNVRADWSEILAAYLASIPKTSTPLERCCVKPSKAGRS